MLVLGELCKLKNRCWTQRWLLLVVTYDDAEPTERVRTWLSLLGENGITVIFLSNNNRERVAVFTKSIDKPWYAPASKPLVKTAKKALFEHGFTQNETAVLGDQVFTDVWTGNFLGVKLTLLVPPIKDKKTLFFRFKRLCERPFIRRYAKQNGYCDWMAFWKIKP